jgi:prepilin-type N-terminal cleavage/methylation domain-containing protein
MNPKAFTLIELLIVVAILAVLAAIAVPNFLEAQTRSKVARVSADMRSIATALECYCADNNAYPIKPSSSCKCGWQGALTTPIPYILTAYRDPFADQQVAGSRTYQYSICNMMKSWIFVSIGPDLVDDFQEDMWMCGRAETYPMPYDPTNGTISRGDIARVNRVGGSPLIPSH